MLGRVYRRFRHAAVQYKRPLRPCMHCLKEHDHKNMFCSSLCHKVWHEETRLEDKAAIIAQHWGIMEHGTGFLISLQRVHCRHKNKSKRLRLYPATKTAVGGSELIWFTSLPGTLKELGYTYKR